MQLPRRSLVLALCLALAWGCAESKVQRKASKTLNGPAARDVEKETRTKEDGKKEEMAREPAGGSKGEAKGAPPAPLTPPTKTASDEKAEDRPAATAPPLVGKAKAKRAERRPAGVLTAGSFDDNLNPRFFRAFAGKAAQHPTLGELAKKFEGQRLIVLVKNAKGAPVGNARVRIAGTAGGPGVELTTRSDGRVVFLSSFDGVEADKGLTVTVSPPDGSRAVAVKVPRAVERWEVTLPEAKAPLPKKLDLAIVLDTTGSMGDELEFLKTEFKSIVAAVRKQFPEVEQRYALVLFRDEGDEYVTRTFGFTPSVAEFNKNLAPQRAAGGGDYPEATHRGLEEAKQLAWRDADTARVLFLVTDAPPHAQHFGRTLAAADVLRKAGVAIYPIACSGYNDEAEFILRGCGLLTGGQFLFLTDDSGVGAAHAEPRIPFYHVEKLDRLMIRMIAGELSGKRLPPTRAEIIRTVGKPIN
jgi:hypothetical protein